MIQKRLVKEFLVFVVALLLICACSIGILKIYVDYSSCKLDEKASKDNSPYNPPTEFHPNKLYGSLLDVDGKTVDANNKTLQPQPQHFRIIPNLVHITVGDKTLVTGTILSWVRLNPNFNVILYDDSDISSFISDISKFNPEILETFRKLSTIVEKTGYWRYLVMYYYGGVYADSDVQDRVGIEFWPSWKEAGVKAIAGTEFVLDEDQIIPYEAVSTR